MNTNLFRVTCWKRTHFLSECLLHADEWHHQRRTLGHRTFDRLKSTFVKEALNEGGGRYKRSYFASVAPRRFQFTSFDAGLISRTQICNKSPWQKHPELWCFLLFQIIPFYMNHLLLNSGYTQWHTNYTSSTGSLNFDVYLGVTVILV